MVDESTLHTLNAEMWLDPEAGQFEGPAEAKDGWSLWEELQPGRKLVVFGAGGSGRAAVRYLRHNRMEPLCLVDNDRTKWGLMVDGVKVVSPEILGYLNPDLILIASDWAADIAAQLNHMGMGRHALFGHLWMPDWERFHDTKLISAGQHKLRKVSSLLSDEESKRVLWGLIQLRITLDARWLPESTYAQYAHSKIRACPGDRIVDGGAWNGDTVALFNAQTGGDCEIWAFEPDTSNLSALNALVDERGMRQRVHPIGKGLWESRCQQRFAPNPENSGRGSVSSQGGTVELERLDDLTWQWGVRIDLIKLDIEGSELQALRGAAETIARDKPKLQICVYHKPADLWELPLYIHGLNPDYRFFLGHHSQSLCDTVLYAV